MQIRKKFKQIRASQENLNYIKKQNNQNPENLPKHLNKLKL